MILKIIVGVLRENKLSYTIIQPYIYGYVKKLFLVMHVPKVDIKVNIVYCLFFLPVNILEVYLGLECLRKFVSEKAHSASKGKNLTIIFSC